MHGVLKKITEVDNYPDEEIEYVLDDRNGTGQ